MPDFPSCFGENGVRVSHSSIAAAGRHGSNLKNRTTARSSSCSSNTNSNSSNSSTGSGSGSVTSVYQTKSGNVTVTWHKNPVTGHGLVVAIDNSHEEEVVRPWKKKGSKTLSLGPSAKLDVFWDLSAARYGPSPGPEPLDNYFVAAVAHGQIVLLLGDLHKEAILRTSAHLPPLSSSSSPVSESVASAATLVSRKEHIFARRSYSTRVRFAESGVTHDIDIDCQVGGSSSGKEGMQEPQLRVRVDRQLVIQVKRLTWKFRGNATILVDGRPVDVLWDAHNWLFSPTESYAVFMFQPRASLSDHWSFPCFKPFKQEAITTTTITTTTTTSSTNNNTNTNTANANNGEIGSRTWNHPFSLLLYAWKCE